MKAVLLAALALAAVTVAGRAGERLYTPVAPPLFADWQDPQALPPQFRNHCGFAFGRYYCADHCGSGYQVYYCSQHVSGCCRVGLGYCDDQGILRCSP